MKILSLWQPWASFVAIEIKRNETRHWYSSYRGELCIHAGKRKPTQTEIAELERLLRGADRDLSFMGSFTGSFKDWVKAQPYGKIVAHTHMTDFLRMQHEPTTWRGKVCIDDQLPTEIACGLWREGRYAFRFERTTSFLSDPIPWVGIQTPFQSPTIELIDEVAKRLVTR